MSHDAVDAPHLAVRRVTFDYRPDFAVQWTPRTPEFSCAANSVSLLMPFIEPFFVHAVRGYQDDLAESGEHHKLSEQTTAYTRQELQHHRAHIEFNALLRENNAGIGRVENWAERTIDSMKTKRSRAFKLAFAASSETIAYSAARWAAERRMELFSGADPEAATLFLWHLAEEVEHKSSAFDLYHAVDGSKLRLLWSNIAAICLLMWFVALGTTVLLWNEKRLFNPVAHVRLWRWAIPFAFEVLTNMASLLMPSHHPSDLTDPSFYELWLREFDEGTSTLPLWNSPVTLDSPG